MSTSDKRDLPTPADAEYTALIEEGARFFRRSCTFVQGVASLTQLPSADLPEICMAGRSNVGKSSLINALTGRKGLARTSDTPGRTQEINFFSLDDCLLLADLPGYGYARAPREKVQKWTEMIKVYLKGRQNLRRIFLLIDSRHGLKDNDREIMEMLDQAAVNYQVVLTKTDKLREAALERVVSAVRSELAQHAASHPVILCTSSTKATGLDALRAEIAMLTHS